MRFLIRCAFWLALALLFIPFDTSGHVPDEETTGPIQALAAARDAVGDLTGFCERQPAVCATASTAIHTIAARAREGMRLAEELVNAGPAEAEAAGGIPDVQEAPTGSIAPSNQDRSTPKRDFP